MQYETSPYVIFSTKPLESVLIPTDKSEELNNIYRFLHENNDISDESMHEIKATVDEITSLLDKYKSSESQADLDSIDTTINGLTIIVQGKNESVDLTKTDSLDSIPQLLDDPKDIERKPSPISVTQRLSTEFSVSPNS